MTWRARGYLGIAGARHLAVGVYVLACPADFTADAYQVITAMLPMWLWGLLSLIGGGHLLYAASRGAENHARVALVMSAMSSSFWAVGFFMGFFVGGVVTLIGAIIFTALTLKDLVVCAQPMRSPFERFVREYAETPGG
ncbi:hypothetical protein [Nocardioides sp. SYSU DS0663]|uniref:hypothetical protein n=1 Tax=Nocardioides sp. SYSU DS0663 TaxID=3416445 RepID=UPI003F4C6C98